MVPDRRHLRGVTGLSAPWKPRQAQSLRHVWANVIPPYFPHRVIAYEHSHVRDLPQAHSRTPQAGANITKTPMGRERDRESHFRAHGCLPTPMSPRATQLKGHARSINSGPSFWVFFTWAQTGIASMPSAGYGCNSAAASSIGVAGSSHRA